MTCEHCDGSGILNIDRAVDADTGAVLARDYDSPCHACPAGQAWTDAARALDVTHSPWLHLAASALDLLIGWPLRALTRKLRGA